MTHRWTRPLGAVLAAAALGAASAPVAHATDITNPAEHPAPITVDIDGQTYHDGADTLPGYDDYACTPIPNVEYDFGENQIQYYDGDGELVQTAHWTEWSRISSYETWVAQHGGGTPTTPAPTPSSGTSTTTSTSATTSGGAGTTTQQAAATAPAATSNPTTSAATGTSTPAKTTKSATKTAKSHTKTTGSATKSAGSGATSTSTGSTKTTASGTSSPAASSPGAKDASGRAATSGPAKHGKAGQTGKANAAGTTAGATAAGAGSAAADPAAVAAGTTAVPAGTATVAGGTTAGAEQPKYKLVSDKGSAAGGDTRPVGIGILVAVFTLAGAVFLYGLGRRGLRTSSF